MLLPDIRRISGDWYIFQQDSAPAHRARATMDFLERETPEFISPLLLPPNSPALNAVDYSVWSISYCKRMCTKHASLISTTSNIVSEPSGPSWITPSLLQLCVSGVVVFQLVSGRAVVISSTAFNPDIVFCGTCSVWSLRIVESNRCTLIFRSDFLAVVSYDVVRFHTWRSFNSQGKVCLLYTSDAADE